MNIKSILDALFQEVRAKNPTIPQADFDKMTAEVEKRVKSEPPPQVAFIGETGVGKSSTLNALFGAGRDVGHTEACTQEEAVINIKAETVEGEKGILIAYDMPGLGEGITKREKHLETYKRVLQKVDAALWILDAQDRAIESVQQYLKEDIRAINPELVERMVFALS